MTRDHEDCVFAERGVEIRLLTPLKEYGNVRNMSDSIPIG